MVVFVFCFIQNFFLWMHNDIMTWLSLLFLCWDLDQLEIKGFSRFLWVFLGEEPGDRKRKSGHSRPQTWGLWRWEVMILDLKKLPKSPAKMDRLSRKLMNLKGLSFLFGWELKLSNLKDKGSISWRLVKTSYCTFFFGGWVSQRGPRWVFSPRKKKLWNF